MAEKDTLYQGKIKQGGIFSFKDFYSFTYDWLRDEGYDLIEKSYSEKVKGDSKELKIKWEAERDISDYFRFVIQMDWFIIGMKDVEVQKEGKKVKMNSGLLEIKFKAILVRDYENRWEDRPIWKFLKGVYDRYIIRARIEDYENKILEELNELIDQCKSFLALEAKA